jgi:flavin reductase (DIM6/NTAB) family NADH-FMN oxidoreductase RutF
VTAGTVGAAETLAATPRAHDPRWFRTTLGQYPTGVSVVTAVDDDGEPLGMVVGSFSSVSLDPPLVSFMPMLSSKTWAALRPLGRFCVNILAEDQEGLCRAFSAKSGDKYADVAWRPGPTGSPILADAVAWIDCEVETILPAGDHEIVVGRVLDLEVENPRLPLLFFQGGYGRFTPRSLAVRDTRFGAELRLIDRARPAMEAVAAQTGTQVLVAHCDGVELTLLARAGTGTDPRVGPAIGQHLGVTAPLGVWRMAHAPAAEVERWLADVGSAEQRERYETALAEVREAGYCLGLSRVHDEVSDAIGGVVPGPGAAPAPHRVPELDALVDDPRDYSPARVRPDDLPADHPEVVSLWAPTFQSDGGVGLGVVLTGFAPDGPPLSAYADRLRDLADELTALARG